MPTDDDMTAGHPSSRQGGRDAEAPAPSTLGPLSATWPLEAPANDTLVYGPDIADERTLRLLGTVEGKRILELGTGNGANAVWLARQGAKVISIDPSSEAIEAGRELAERQEVKVEHHQGDLADVAFVRADGIDLVLSVYALAAEPDIDRVFRQAHRVLRPECPIVASVPHPAFALVDAGSADPQRIAHSYFDRAPRPWQIERRSGVEHVRTFADLFGGLYRANFRIDAVVEPEPVGPPHSRWWSEVMHRVPSTMIVRARKLGI